MTTEEEKGVVPISDVSLAPIGAAILYKMSISLK